MADDSKIILERIKQHFDRLVNKCASLENENNILNSKIALLEKDIIARNEKIEELTNELNQNKVRYKNLQISQKAGLDASQLQENKERYAKLVREIDKCISLLKE